MAVYNPKETKEEDKLQKAINLGKQIAYKEVLQWLEDNFFTGEIVGYCSGIPDIIVQGKFDCKEQMLQSFKERFNIE